MVPARSGIVTLGVADLDRSVAFYRALGWEHRSSSIEGVIHWFGTADTNLGLFPYQDLADDARSAPRSAARSAGSRSPQRGAVRGRGRGLAAAVEAGRRSSSRRRTPRFGRSGYFADPDGYPWEIAYNPSSPSRRRQPVTIP